MVPVGNDVELPLSTQAILIEGIDQSASLHKLLVSRRLTRDSPSVEDSLFASSGASSVGVARSVLEYLAGAGAFAEALELLGVPDSRALGERRAEVRLKVIALVGEDVEATFTEVARRLARKSPLQPLETFTNVVQSVVGELRRLLGTFPLDAICDSAEAAEHPEDTFRCRRAFAWLRAFVGRHSDLSDAALLAAAHAYAEGRLEVDEISRLLGRSIADVVADLERLQLRRVGGQRELSEASRKAAIQALMRPLAGAERSSAITRDVVATQRIEGIDARQVVALRRDLIDVGP